MESFTSFIESTLVNSLAPQMSKDLDIDIERVVKSIKGWLGLAGETHIEPPKAKKAPAAATQPKKPTDTAKVSTKMKINDLRALCEQRGINSTGTKATLVARLGDEFPPDAADANEDKPKKRAPVKKLETVAKKTKPKKVEPKVDVDVYDADTIVAVEDEFGNIVDEKRGLVFDKENRVIAFKDAEGVICSLTREQINLAKSLGLEYELPEEFDSDKD